MNQDHRTTSLEDQVRALSDTVKSLEPLVNEVAYLKGVINYQGSRIEKLSGIVLDMGRNDDNGLLTLSTLQDGSVGVGVEDAVNQLDDQTNNPSMSSSTRPPPQSIAPAQPHTHNHTHTHGDLDGNINPQLQGGGGDDSSSNDKKRPYGGSQNHMKPITNKKPKISIDFIHNPMTVKEIYEEFYNGFKGQPPLVELDQRYGKAQWRGDSRSKESKRYQRRKRLCDAIKKGTVKYDKTPEEIIKYIEEFRGDKSLTWVMNGNIPKDLQ
ncbi:hypothetical protein PSN45_002746 [Yamadazyma tenuis]|uniref:Transcription activator GCR1-like domain-containing protein n=1 Tax=Candida tenuis (strain ATCC 10573 / BCRC 21748 / CBS 615 / JCM 9827 / NBRC 10315 / NRRL Y-1498 / VKM Y-70) TaxID=590646 RepID=G3AWX4_CANTC|nr:uncharacterized protein CANTEDRAFT_112352 [Yamadazyma tenuis ATCC 10573]EGV66643.1 hypothetical protein CANTEDRAFT_112352 [Yamadazyma tenuis ATCC 10573]WEJ95233.1 hypothetical protein PSN45_002746 [Yamadazyma tenuis]